MVKGYFFFKVEKMGKKPLLLAVERAQIVTLHIKRLSKRQIAKRSVHHVIKKFKKHEIYDNIKKLIDPVKCHKEMIMQSEEMSCDLTLVLAVKYVSIC